jgi:hypothetical protein
MDGRVNIRIWRMCESSTVLALPILHVWRLSVFEDHMNVIKRCMNIRKDILHIHVPEKLLYKSIHYIFS